MLCGLVLNGLVSSMKALEFLPGRDFELVVVTFDPKETPELAAAKRALLRRALCASRHRGRDPLPYR